MVNPKKKSEKNERKRCVDNFNYIGHFGKINRASYYVTVLTLRDAK